ncbi:hypothetical protein [Poseidonocella sp. HB161398]|uniref:hypothetical protein n=1 Tax=Poseidonocella sp. HB161398 TaxID=2320855 RepID=UPI001107E88F|nr:hypothetical protein [Poseidonocella sp. HB161398]
MKLRAGLPAGTGRGRALRPLAVLLGLVLAVPAARAEDGLPVFDGLDGYAVIAPYEGGLLVQDRRGTAFLCGTDIANIVLLKDCRPVLTGAQVEAYSDARAEAERQGALQEERNRVLALPEAQFEQAGRKVLSSRGCQVELGRSAAMRSEVLPAFAAALGIPAELQPGLLRMTDDLFTQTLERLLRQRQITFDRATRVARLVECEQ